MEEEDKGRSVSSPNRTESWPSLLFTLFYKNWYKFGISLETYLVYRHFYAHYVRPDTQYENVSRKKTNDVTQGNLDERVLTKKWNDKRNDKSLRHVEKIMEEERKGKCLALNRRHGPGSWPSLLFTSCYKN